MKKERLINLLREFQSGKNSADEIIEEILGVSELSHATIDIERQKRTGHPETIFGEGKTIEQIVDIVHLLKSKEQTTLVTRLTPEKGTTLQETFPEGEWSKLGRTFLLKPEARTLVPDLVGLICAGTSDIPVLEEARMTLHSVGLEPTVYHDIGVAGLHRFLNRVDDIRTHKVLIVIAGMEGALTSVVAGMVSTPIIGVPTSVGYGSHLNGLTPLLGMLNSCAPGVVVCNIDNGYGAAMAAFRMVSSVMNDDTIH